MFFRTLRSTAAAEREQLAQNPPDPRLRVQRGRRLRRHEEEERKGELTFTTFSALIVFAFDIGKLKHLAILGKKRANIVKFLNEFTFDSF